jgi:hypothetical protein
LVGFKVVVAFMWLIDPVAGRLFGDNCPKIINI